MESVCFTGEYYEMTRAELTEKASKMFEVRKSVTKDLDILVCDDPNSGSSKLEKAKKNGTRVITYKEFMDMVDDIKDDGVFYIRNGVLKKCRDDNIENVVIPSGVTEIDFSAFLFCFHLKSIEIPEGVKEIGREFQGFSELESVIIHEGTQIIKYNAFEKNPLLKFVQLPSSLIEIQTEAFLRCSSLSKIVFEGTIEQWKKVKGLENLLQYVPAKSVKCSNGEWQKPLVFVEDGVAVKCLDKSTTSIKLDEGVTAISENAFKECASVLSIELPSTLTEIRKGAFDDCKNVEKIVSHSPLFTFDEKTKKLYDMTGKTKKVVLSLQAGKEEAKKEKIAQVQNVSASSVLESIMSEHKTNAEVISDDKNAYLQIQTTDGGFEIVLADSKVSKWMENLPAFLDFVATGADSIAIRKFAIERGLEDSSKKFISISKDGCVSWKKKTNPVYLFIPEGVSKIGEEAFSSCKSLEYVVIPEGVKKIEDDAFHNCKYLEQVVFPDGLEEIGHSAFTDCKSLTKLVFPPSLKVIGNSAFYCCEYLKDFEIPNGVEKIEAGAFSTNSRFESLRIPGSVKIIEHASFKECHELKTLVIEKGVEKIEKEAFQDCEKLSEITYTGTVAEWEKIEKERKWHYNVPAQSVKCSDGESSIAVNREVIKTDTYKLAIYDNGVEECVCTGVTEKLVIPEGVTLIEYGAFYGVKGIKSVELPSSLTKIDEGALSHCVNLKSVVFPPNITAIEKDAFRGCTEIESFEIPEGVTTIGRDAFKDCTALKSIKIPESVTVIDDAFGRCTALESIVLPACLTEIDFTSFSGCSSLRDITFKGTKAQWNAAKEYFWQDEDLPAKVVHCSDGDVEIEEY